MTMTVVISDYHCSNMLLASKIIWCFHSYGIFAHFSLPPTFTMPFSLRKVCSSFDLLFFPHCWVGVEYSSLKDSFWINAFKISFNFSSFALHLVINLQWLMLSHELVSSTMNSLEANTDRFFQLCKKKHFLFISSLVSGNYSIILFSFSLVCVTPKKFLPLIPWFLLILLIF